MHSTFQGAAVLIGGTSHSGKSTVARELAALLRGEYLSTDTLGRHPGRPWRNDGSQVPPHVREHYLKLTLEEKIADVFRHYRENIWPQVEARVRMRAAGAAPLVVEGSAILPELVAAAALPNAQALWLLADEALVQERMYAESRYVEKQGEDRTLIENFFERTMAFQRHLEEQTQALGLVHVRVSATDTVAEIVQKCVATLRG